MLRIHCEKQVCQRLMELDSDREGQRGLGSWTQRCGQCESSDGWIGCGAKLGQESIDAGG